MPKEAKSSSAKREKKTSYGRAGKHGPAPVVRSVEGSYKAGAAVVRPVRRAIKAEGRIDIRVDEEKKDVIAQAAALNGQNISQYIMSLVWPDAEKRVSETTRVRLSSRDWKLFCERLDARTHDLPELRKLLNRPGRFNK